MYANINLSAFKITGYIILYTLSNRMIYHFLDVLKTIISISLPLFKLNYVAKDQNRLKSLWTFIATSIEGAKYTCKFQISTLHTQKSHVSILRNLIK